MTDRDAIAKAEMQARLEPLSGTGYAVGHDAYQYLERAVGLPANWAVTDASGQDPAPRDAAALHEAVLAGDVTCLLLDAESDPAWAGTLGEGAALRVATVDPDGVTLEPGPELAGAAVRGAASSSSSSSPSSIGAIFVTGEDRASVPAD